MSTSSLPKAFGPNILKTLKESSKHLRELRKVDPRDRYVLLFPPANSSYVGMSFNLLNTSAAEDIFQKANSLVKKDLLKLTLAGPSSDLLGSIENRHLAAFVTSHATVAKMLYERPEVVPLCKAAGGFGVGFINSLVFSQAMSFENALDLVQKVGQGLDRASKVIPNAKLKLRVMPATSRRIVCSAAREHCLSLGIPNEIAVCSITQYKQAHVLEISGHEEAIKYLETEGQRLFKFRWCSRVSKCPDATHTDLMKPVKEFINLYINQRMEEDPDYLKDPETCSVYSSTSGLRHRKVESIKSVLIQYPVRPIKSLHLINCMFTRPHDLAQPNIIVVWDKNIMNMLKLTNRKAHDSASMFR